MTRKELIDRLNDKAALLRRYVIASIGVGVAGHVGGSLSSADMAAALYFYKLRYDPQNLKWEKRDRFILSKGHVAVLQYACLAAAGIIDVDELYTTKAIGSRLQGHPDTIKTPGVEVGTGSLGQGLSIGLGMALGQRLDGFGARTYVLMGDGELAEGQIWEAAMAAGHYKAENLIGILDNNGLQATGPVSERMDSAPLREKWEAFGWRVMELDGHDMAQIVDALDAADSPCGKPTLLLMHTVKGKGLSFAENNAAFHNGVLTKELYDRAMAELGDVK